MTRGGSGRKALEVARSQADCSVNADEAVESTWRKEAPSSENCQICGLGLNRTGIVVVGTGRGATGLAVVVYAAEATGRLATTRVSWKASRIRRYSC